MELLFPLPVWIVTLALCLLHAYRSPRTDHVAAIVKAFALSVLWTVAAVAAFWGSLLLFALLIEKTEKGIVVAIAAWAILYIAVALAAFGRQKAGVTVVKFSNGIAAQETQPPRPTKLDTIEMSDLPAEREETYASFLHSMNTKAQSVRKRPKMVWAIFVFYVFSIGYTMLSIGLVFSGAIPLSAEQAAYFKDLSAFDWTISTLVGLLNAAGAIAIFRLRKIGLYLFAASVILGLLQTIVQVISTNYLAALGGGGAAGSLIGYVILFAVCIYAWKLKARGVLV